MKMILYLLRVSWPAALLAGLVGAVSGGASVALIAMILRTVENPNASNWMFVGLFAGLCATVLLTRVASQLLVSRLTQASILDLQMGLCRRVLDSPVKHLEEIGSRRILATITGEVNNVSHAMGGVPELGVNMVIFVFGAIYLGTLSFSLLVAALVFCAVGAASYWYSARWADQYVEKAREEQNLLQQRIQELTEGVKELKMHHARRREFVDGVLLKAQVAARRSQFVGDFLEDTSIGWGRLTFFIAIGLLLFAWPRFVPTDVRTLNGYVLTILYLMSPLEQIMGWLPVMNWAAASVTQIEQLGLMLREREVGTDICTPVTRWERIEFQGVTHAYKCQGRPHGFELGPLDLTLNPGEVVFVIGGNGSGKTTLAKLITGLYVPETGDVLLDGKPIMDETREGYRQLFSTVFDDAMVFDSLWGLDSEDRDGRAQDYLQQLELDRVVTVKNGAFSTTSLSRGQRKRLALLTAYLEDRPIYVFDEWAADQDPSFRRVFYRRLVPDLKRRGKTVVAITHDDRYFDCADRIIKLEEGRVVERLRHEVLHQTQLEPLT